MELNEYQTLAMRTEANDSYDPDVRMTQRLTNALMGLNGEAGEAIDILKKCLFQGHELEIDELIEELGDVMWYLAEAADAVGITLEDVAQLNIDKLKKRYPHGFTKEASIHRFHENPESSYQEDA